MYLLIVLYNKIKNKGNKEILQYKELEVKNRAGEGYE